MNNLERIERDYFTKTIKLLNLKVLRVSLVRRKNNRKGVDVI